MGRFITKDLWHGDIINPITLNQWIYVNGNPVLFTDPSGKSICYNPLPASCQSGLIYANATATVLRDFVKSGTRGPVDVFAMFAELRACKSITPRNDELRFAKV
jgi:hypothetical protein